MGTICSMEESACTQRFAKYAVTGKGGRQEAHEGVIVASFVGGYCVFVWIEYGSYTS